MEDRKEKILPNEEDAERFEEWCFENFGEGENNIPEDAYDRFCEEDQGNEVDYTW